MRFSERYGYKQVRELVQVESIDLPLRNALWSLLNEHVWGTAPGIKGNYGVHSLSDYEKSGLAALCWRLWYYYFKKPIDTLDDDWRKVLGQLRKYFFEAEWYEVYDFIEFIAQNDEDGDSRNEFIEPCNEALEREMSAYRFVGCVITQITAQQEIAEIEDALARARGPTETHLRRALELLSSRTRPDYRNSIKESISAVESLVKITLKNNKGTLGELLKRLEKEINLHPALKSAFSNLYGYSSDAGGIRHALLDSETIRFEDAKFFMVVCSAFVNFVVTTSVKDV
jgi:hypothetical protein